MAKDILILGGGVIGLATAFECQNRGHQVTILEIATCGGQASGAAAGMLAPYSEMSEEPDDFFLLSHQSLKEYPVWQQEIKNKSSIDFEYVESGSLYTIFHEAERFPLQTRMEWQNKFGVEASIIEKSELKEKEPALSEEILAALYTPSESHLYSPDYVKALKQACLNTGVRIYEHLKHVEVIGWKDEVHLRSYEDKHFFADHLIICNGAWSKELENSFGIAIPVFPIRGQICSYRTDSLTRSLVFSSQGYVVSKGNGSLVCGASEDIAGFNVDVTEKGIKRLERWSKKLLPVLETMETNHRWAGLRPATQDGFPFIGQLSNYNHVQFATGHYRNGILLSPITAKVVADQIDGLKERVPLRSFSPERFS